MLGLVKKYNIFYMHVKELKIMPLSMPIENSLWHARYIIYIILYIIFNLNRIYIKNIKVPRLPLTNCHFSVLFFQFLFFIIKLFFRLKLSKLLLLIHYILVMYSFNLHHLLLLQSGDIEINPGPMKCSRLNFCHWNLSGIAAHDFVKVHLIEAFINPYSAGVSLN